MITGSRIVSAGELAQRKAEDTFKRAIEGLTGAKGDIETMYQSGKRRTLADIAMGQINAGMGNTVNMPAAGIAYDQTNRAPTNVALAQLKSNLMQSLGQTQAGFAEQGNALAASKYNAEMNAVGQVAAAKERSDTDRYLAGLSAKMVNSSKAGWPSQW